MQGTWLLKTITLFNEEVCNCFVALCHSLCQRLLAK